MNESEPGTVFYKFQRKGNLAQDPIGIIVGPLINYWKFVA